MQLQSKCNKCMPYDMIINYLWIVCSSIYWEEYYKKSSYPDLFPRCPRIVDPANPTNNLYETGISGRYNRKRQDYGDSDGDSDGDWRKFVCHVDTLDLTVPVEQVGTGVYQQVGGIRL